jgi:AraC family transcriptional regulator
MISALNRLADLVEERLGAEVDVAAVAQALGSSEYHLRRMFSSLAGMPLSEYVRRRRMTVAAADVVRGEDDLLGIAVRYGYGSAEAFGRAFKAVHGAGPGDVRRDGGPLRTQPQVRFRLTVEGSEPMETRIVDRPAFRLVGHAARVPLKYEGVNSRIQEHVARLPASEHQRLKDLGDTEPAGLLAVSDDIGPDAAEGTELTYLHGVAVTAGRVRAGRPRHRTWKVFCSSGNYPEKLQRTWAAIATERFPVEPAAGASLAVDRGDARSRGRLQHGPQRAPVGAQ